MSIDTEKLQQALESGVPGKYEAPTVAQLKIEAIDTSGWEEFAAIGGGSWFDQPDVRSTIYQSGAPLNLVLDCSYFSVISADKEKAVAALRRDLAYIKNLWPKIKVVGFLAKPSLFEIITEVKPHEEADANYVTDLRGPRPGKKKWAAFCFLFAYEPTNYDYGGTVGHRPLTPKRWREWGLPSAVREGEVGQELPDVDQTFMAAAQPPYVPAGATTALDAKGLLNPEKVTGTVEFSHKAEDFDPLKDESLGWGSLHTNWGEDGTWDEIDVSDLEPERIEYQGHKLDKLTAQGVTDPVRLSGFGNLPEVKAAAENHGVDLSAPPGRELQEMRKYFGSGSGLYMASVDFQTARVSATPLTEEAQKRILKVLQPKLVRKPRKKPAKKKPAKRLTRRAKSR